MKKKIIHLGTGDNFRNRLRKLILKSVNFDIGVNNKPPSKLFPRNFGDRALTEIFQNIIKYDLNAKPVFMSCREIFTQKDIDFINKHDALIIGGGGLFLYDTFKNIESDWQWGISLNNLKKIRIPIITYSVGYNKFRGQRNFTKKFDETVTELINKSKIFTIRHQGDIDKLKKHVTTDLHNKIRLNVFV
jgi:hypothetical protein